MSSLRCLLPASPPTVAVPAAFCLSRRLAKITKWVWPWLLSGPHARPWSAWDPPQAFKEESLCFLQCSCSPVHKPCLPSHADISGSLSCWHKIVDLKSWRSAQTPCPLGKGARIITTLAVVIILPFVNHLLEGVGLDYTGSSPLSPISWFLLDIFSCERCVPPGFSLLS